MNRRGFLKALLIGAAGTVVASTIDVDKLLWQPGEKTHILPPTCGWRDLGSHLQMDAARLLADSEHGIRLKLVRQFDAQQQVVRLDVLYGFAALRPELAVRIRA